MLKLKLFFLCIISFSQSFAQNDKLDVFLKDNNISVNLYSDPTGRNISNTIMNDSLYEYYFAFTILENSPLMFYVEVKSCSQQNSPTIYGWVEKKYCGVYVRYYNTESDAHIRLYEEPDSRKKYQKLNISLQSPVIVVDTRDKWVKVLFLYDGIYYEGWIDKYCSSIYNSCT